MWSLEILRYHFRASNRHQTLADLLVIEVISRANIGIQPRGQQVLHTEPEASECPNNTNYSMSCGWLMMVGLIGLGNWTSRKFHRNPALNVWRRVIPETRETMGDHGRPWETMGDHCAKWIQMACAQPQIPPRICCLSPCWTPPAVQDVAGNWPLVQGQSSVHRASTGFCIAMLALPQGHNIWKKTNLNHFLEYLSLATIQHAPVTSSAETAKV